MLALKLLPLFLVAAIAALAVLHHEFNDNLLQRIGLSGVCIGATLSMVSVLQDHGSRGESYTILVYGLAIYAIGTLVKFKRLHKT